MNPRNGSSVITSILGTLLGGGPESAGGQSLEMLTSDGINSPMPKTGRIEGPNGTRAWMDVGAVRYIMPHKMCQPVTITPTVAQAIGRYWALRTAQLAEFQTINEKCASASTMATFEGAEARVTLTQMVHAECPALRFHSGFSIMEQSEPPNTYGVICDSYSGTPIIITDEEVGARMLKLYEQIGSSRSQISEMESNVRQLAGSTDDGLSEMFLTIVQMLQRTDSGLVESFVTGNLVVKDAEADPPVLEIQTTERLVDGQIPIEDRIRILIGGLIIVDPTMINYDWATPQPDQLHLNELEARFLAVFAAIEGNVPIPDMVRQVAESKDNGDVESDDSSDTVRESAKAGVGAES